MKIGLKGTEERVQMGNFLRLGIVLLLVSLAVNCSEQEFSSVPSNTCVNLNNAFGPGSCVQALLELNSLNYSAPTYTSYILFVVDHSSLMTGNN